MKDFCLDSLSIKKFITLSTKLARSGKRYRVSMVEWRERRSKSQNSTWRGWMNETAQVLAKRGVQVDLKQPSGKLIGNRPINSQDCHEFFVGLHGGIDAGGKRLMTRHASKDVMADIMLKHLKWCNEREIPITQAINKSG